MVLSDPGRLIGVHLMHTALTSGWSGVMLLYELIIFDLNDPVYNPQWCQCCFVLPFCARIGILKSVLFWNFGLTLDLIFCCSNAVFLSHIFLSGLFILGSFWHWSNWDLDLFTSSFSGRLCLDLFWVFGIHLLLSSLNCFGLGILISQVCTDPVCGLLTPRVFWGQLGT